MRFGTSPCSAPLPAPLVQRPAGQSHGWQSMFSYPNSCPGTPLHTLHHSGACTKLRFSTNYRLQAEPSILLEPPPAPGQEDGTTPRIFGRHIHSGVRQQINIHVDHPITGATHTHSLSLPLLPHGRAQRHGQGRGLISRPTCNTLLFTSKSLALKQRLLDATHNGLALGLALPQLIPLWCQSDLEL